MREVFISYRSEDKDAANRVCSALERENISCWIAPRDIGIGKEWATAIVEGLQQSKAFVLVLSSNSKNARQISREAELADKRGLPTFTFRIEDVDPPPGLLYFLGNIQWLDAFNGQFDSAVVRLAEAVRNIPASEGQGTSGTIGSSNVEETRPAPPRVTAATAASSAARTREESQRTATRNPTLWGAIAAAIVILVLIGWFAFRPKPPSSLSVQDATPAAQAFVADLKTGDFEAAWTMMDPAFRQAHPAWLHNNKEIQNKYGPVTGSRMDSSVANAGGNACTFRYALTYKKDQDRIVNFTVSRAAGNQLGITDFSSSKQ